MEINPIEKEILLLSNAELKDAIKEIIDWHKTGILEDGIVRKLAKVMQTISQSATVSTFLMLSEKEITLEAAKRWIDISSPPEKTEIVDYFPFNEEKATNYAIEASKEYKITATIVDNGSWSVAVGFICVEFHKRKRPELIHSIYELGILKK